MRPVNGVVVLIAGVVPMAIDEAVVRAGALVQLQLWM